MSGILTVVGTPIGNLGDFSPRAQEAIAECDFIAAEDTRVSLKLLNVIGVKKPMISYFEHNKAERGAAICDRIEAGENCVLVTDAGMPAISDPGEQLVALCAERGIPVTVVPGPCALVSALAISGLPTARFTFEGFLPVAKKERRQRLESLAREERTMIFYEAPHKLCTTLADLCSAFGPDRRIALARELTKLHEEVVRTTLGAACERYNQDPPRGEFVLILDGAPAASLADSYTLEDAVALARSLSEEENLSRSEASKRAAAITSFPKSQIYSLF